jgi:hypothetical protein
MSSEGTTTGGATTGTTDTRGDAGSAAERLGGPTEREQRPDTTSEAEENDYAATEARRSREQDPDMTSEAEQRVDAPSEGEQRTDTTSEAEQSADADGNVETRAGDHADTTDGDRATLIAPERAESYNSRWNDLKSEFVDEPRGAVRGANELVGEVLDELEELFRGQRAELEHGLDSEQTTTEDLRLALGRYRSFFDRLLSF